MKFLRGVIVLKCIVTCFEVTRRSHVSRVTLHGSRYEAHFGLAFPAVAIQQSHFSEGQLVIYLWSTRGHSRPDPETQMSI
jgi:hypothetical protein